MIVTVTAGVLAANGLTIWIGAMFWRLKKNENDFSALVQICALLMVVILIALAAGQSLQG